jgi:hypothetical protein
MNVKGETGMGRIVKGFIVVSALLAALAAVSLVSARDNDAPPLQATPTATDIATPTAVATATPTDVATEDPGTAEATPETLPETGGSGDGGVWPAVLLVSLGVVALMVGIRAATIRRSS